MYITNLIVKQNIGLLVQDFAYINPGYLNVLYYAN